MQMSESMLALFNRQVTMELGASISYLQMAFYLDGESLTGMAAWMRAQSDEEKAHALRFADFIGDRGDVVEVGAIEAPFHDFDGAVSVFRASLEQEKAVTESIAEMFRAAQAEADVLSLAILQEFLTEQIEEESTVGAILDRLAMAGDDGGALLELDRELANRPAEE